MPSQFKQKPAVVEAEPWNGTRPNLHRLIAWILESGGEAYIEDNYESQGPDLLVIKTREGNLTVLEGDYVVRDAKGKFSTCKPDVFEQTYEPIWGTD